MPLKIERKNCLAEFPVFPLRDYDEINDEESFYYPKVISGIWLKLETSNDDELTSILAKEIATLFLRIGIDKLIFLGDTEQSWISKLALEKSDYRAFIDAVIYFKLIGADTSFNGAFSVPKAELLLFLIHFYTLVRCDASLPYFHFIDGKTQYLGTLHYSGQIRVDSFSEEAEKRLVDSISHSQFISATS
jgi:hypothetical protein